MSETTPQPTAGDEAHDALVETSLPLLTSTYEAAIDDGMVAPMLFLVDCEDGLGAEMAVAWVGVDAVDNAVGMEQMARDGDSKTTVFARAVPLADCRREVPAVFPYLAAVLEQGLPDGRILVIAVTNGGAAALSVPRGSELDDE